MRNVILGAVVAFFLAQCATVTRGPFQNICVGSKPAGATVQFSECGVGSQASVKTPATVFVNRRATRCTLTFIHPDYAARTVALVRKGRALGRGGPPDGLSNAADAASDLGDNIAGGLVGAGVVIGGTIWAGSRGVDALTGANYEQYPSTVLIDFNKPIANITGRYSLVEVNGIALPATTWATGNEKCRIFTNSGSLVIEENGQWRSTFTEQRSCGEKKSSPEQRTAYGVFTIEGERILLESEAAMASAVFQGDRLNVTVAGPNRRAPLGKDCDGRALYSQKLALRILEVAATMRVTTPEACPQKAVYTLRLSQ